jgi:hypothetical protein
MQLNSSRIAASGVGLVGMTTLAFLLWGQEPASSHARISVPHDWSHRHVVFSNPTTLDQSLRVGQDVRFWHQWYRRNVRQIVPAEESTFDESREQDKNLPWIDDDSFGWFGWFGWFHRRHHKPIPRNPLKRDWSMSLGPNATVGAGNYPAKFSFDITTANCGNAARPDFVVFNTSVNGMTSQASIVAYDNLYSGCIVSGAVPSTYWAYNTGGSVVTSVTLSLDGSQVAFVQTPASAPVASLVLLKWKPSSDGATSTNPDGINIVVPSLYPTCMAPCMTTLPFSGGHNDTNSSPFYDFDNDALYVGDDAGVLHKFQPVFRAGAPAEVGSPTLWPATLVGGFKLSSPVYDSGTGRVFVGNGSNGTSGGQLFAVDGTTGSVFQTSAQLAKGNGITSGPIVDSTAGLIYVFVGTDTGGVTCIFGGMPCSGVYQFLTNSITSGGRETPISEGSPAAGFPIYIGAFDNSYYTSANATGSLYVCGQNAGRALLVKIPIGFGFMSPAPINEGVFALGTPPPNIPCSPVTEVFNPNLNSGVDSGGPQGTDKIFLSTQGTDNANPCSRGGNGGCLWGVPATSWQPGTAYQVGQVILDDGRDMCIQIVTTRGTSDPLREPNWAVNAGVSTTDGTVTWTGKTCLGVLNAPQSWFPNASFGVGFSVLDPNGNIEAASIDAAMGGSTQPNWPMNIGARTADGSQVWVNVGPVDVATLQTPGGTSGIVVDNTVPTGTLAGGSQIYFSSLGTVFGTCGAGHGCAVQASQAGLK